MVDTIIKPDLLILRGKNKATPNIMRTKATEYMISIAVIGCKITLL